jgi:repressor LexA
MSQKNIKAATLSRLTGISKPRLSQYTNGVYIPKADAICSIARALGVSEAYLLGNSDDMTPTLKKDAACKALPLIGEIACGYPVFANEEDGGLIITDLETDGGLFVL